MRTKKSLVEDSKRQPLGESEARIWLFDTFIGILGSLNEFGEHENQVAQFVLGLEKPLELASEGQSYQGSAFLVPAGLLHTFGLKGDKVLMIYLDPQHPLARTMLSTAQGIMHLPELSQDLYQSVQTLSQPTLEEQQIREIFEALLEEWGAVFPEAPLMEIRIEKALRFMSQKVLEGYTLQDLAQRVGVSSERFRHLFREQMGIPFTHYRLWLRLGEAFSALFQGQSITESAHHANFSDSAHLARTFRKYFGDSISGRLLREDGSRFIQGISYRSSYTPTK